MRQGYFSGCKPENFLSLAYFTTDKIRRNLFRRSPTSLPRVRFHILEDDPTTPDLPELSKVFLSFFAVGSTISSLHRTRRCRGCYAEMAAHFLDRSWHLNNYEEKLPRLQSIDRRNQRWCKQRSDFTYSISFSYNICHICSVMIMRLRFN
ncbi:hypothetical protein ABFS82_06G136900 [Erythranthe guttata]|uniref:Uncharacterized protein n=1 Tax=Erythranthe guttata TaxID=4155 RepID=A0A022Q2W2_ERYGU|nr:hypothetical protein MIMGU_mgv1a015667mg [Erythranthe guttata]